MKAGCTTIEGSRHHWLSVVNGKRLCAERNPNLNLHTMQKPIKQDDKSYKCADKKHKVCGNPKADTPESRIFCIPDYIKCPITDITFDSKGEVVVKRDADLGMPIINLQLSQNGPPCIYNN